MAASIIAALALAACAASEPKVSMPHAPIVALTLTATRTVGRIDVDPAQLAAATTVEVELIRVSNPNQQGIELAIAFEPNAGAPEDVGTISPFPSDQGGRFKLRVPAPAKGAASRATSGAFAFTLRPALRERPLELPLAIELATPVLE